MKCDSNLCFAECKSVSAACIQVFNLKLMYIKLVKLPMSLTKTATE